MNPAQFVRSFLPAYMWMLSITLGSLGLAMVHQVSGGAWGVVIRRILGAATRTLPLLTVLFIPIALGLHSLYPWADAAHVADDPILQWKQPYLNVPFFLARAAIYFAVWNVIAFLLNKWSLEQDETGDPTIPRKDAASQRGRPARLRPDDHLCGVRLADVARAALVLDDLRRAHHGRAGALGDGVFDCRPGVARAARAVQRADHGRTTSTTSAT